MRTKKYLLAILKMLSAKVSPANVLRKVSLMRVRVSCSIFLFTIFLAICAVQSCNHTHFTAPHSLPFAEFQLDLASFLCVYLLAADDINNSLEYGKERGNGKMANLLPRLTFN